MEEQEINIIKGLVEELLQKMTMAVFALEVKSSSEGIKECISMDINIEDPQVLIGQNGQTLFEFQRLLRIILNKKLKKDFYLDLDINNYKKQKVEYLKKMAQELADQVVLTKEDKALAPMPSYERRIIHGELSQRQDVISESQGDGDERYVVVKSKI